MTVSSGYIQRYKPIGNLFPIPGYHNCAFTRDYPKTYVAEVACVFALTQMCWVCLYAGLFVSAPNILHLHIIHT